MPVSLRHPVRHMHPRQRESLRGVPLAHVGVIIRRAHLQQNLGGGILSGAIWSVVQEYKRINGDVVELEARTRRDNHSAMRSCANDGCSACERDADRLDRKVTAG